MSEKVRLASLFAYAGFVGGAGATLVLWWYTASGRWTPVVLGFDNSLLIFALPLLGAVLAASGTVPFDEKSFGGREGGLVALFSFVAGCALIGAFGEFGLAGFLAFLLFGFLLFGWALVALGVAMGRRYRNGVAHAL